MFTMRFIYCLLFISNVCIFTWSASAGKVCVFYLLVLVFEFMLIEFWNLDFLCFILAYA